MTKCWLAVYNMMKLIVAFLNFAPEKIASPVLFLEQNWAHNDVDWAFYLHS